MVIQAITLVFPVINSQYPGQKTKFKHQGNRQKSPGRRFHIQFKTDARPQQQQEHNGPFGTFTYLHQWLPDQKTRD